MLQLEHYDILLRAIKNVLSTDLAIFIYAQIIDGFPTADVVEDRRLPGISGDHPIDDHEDLCYGCVDKACEFYDNWDPTVLKFDVKVTYSFYN